MADLKEYISQPETMGNIFISEEVIASIAAVSAAEVEGVSSIVGGRDPEDKKSSPGKGVHLHRNEDGTVAELAIIIAGGSAVRAVAEQVQDAIISNVYDMTGFKIDQVNVSVAGIAF